MNEKPVTVIPGKGKHKTETRVFARNIHEHFCAQKGCKFYGKHARKGICHTTKTFADHNDWTYIDVTIKAAEKAAKEQLTIYRKAYKDKPRAYLKRLEDQVFSAWLDNMFHMDEMVHTRRENTLLKHEVERLKKALKKAKKP